MGHDVSLRDLEGVLKGLVDDFSTIKADCLSPHLLRGHRPEDLMPEAESVLIHITALKHTIGRYRPGGWWNNRYQHVRTVNKAVSSFLACAGFRTVCPSPWGHNRRTLMPKLQFKPIAFLAGLGWIGKNNLLIHPEFGPRTVIGVVITDARLEEAHRPVMANQCGDCDLCLRVCPVGKDYEC